MKRAILTRSSGKLQFCYVLKTTNTHRTLGDAFLLNFLHHIGFPWHGRGALAGCMPPVINCREVFEGLNGHGLRCVLVSKRRKGRLLSACLLLQQRTGQIITVKGEELVEIHEEDGYSQGHWALGATRSAWISPRSFLLSPATHLLLWTLHLCCCLLN